MLTGGQLAGSNSTYIKPNNEYYATNPKAVDMLFNTNLFVHLANRDTKFLEPCVGGGHIIDTVKKYIPNGKYTAVDITDRQYPNTIVQDFLKWNTDEKFNLIVTNPPYSMAMEFVEKGLELLDNDGYMAMFLKIQFLEGQKRKNLFENNPPKYIYVFRNRMGTWRNGSELKDDGTKWASTTMCHAWFVWKKDNREEPIVRWL